MKKNIVFVLVPLLVVMILLAGCTGQNAQRLGNIISEAEKEMAAQGVPTPTATVVSTGNTAFSSDGDLISGWYWLRDKALRQSANWTITDVPAGNDAIKLDLEVLATNGVNGGRGHDAKFKLYFSALPIDSISASEEITLPNVSPSSDPVGYTCRGTVEVPRLVLGHNTTLYLKAVRTSANDNHVAFNETSVKLAK